MVQLFGTMESSNEEKPKGHLEMESYAGRRVLYHLCLGYKGRA
jgi:hypothetical protein